MKNSRKKMKKWVVGIFAVIFVFGLTNFTFFSNASQRVIESQLKKNDITSIEVRGNEIYMAGLINDNTRKQLEKLLDENTQINTLVLEDVFNAFSNESLIKLGYMIRDKGLNTKLLYSSQVEPRGVDLFIAGVKRSMEKGAYVGTSSWSLYSILDGNLKERIVPGTSQSKIYRKYIDDMLGSDDFYTFEIGVHEGMTHEMSYVEMLDYKILTSPLIENDFANNTGIISGSLAHKFYSAGNSASDTVVINAQGGPVTWLFDSDFEDIFINEMGLNPEEVFIVNVHQTQTLFPDIFTTKEISFEEAKEYDKRSVDELSKVVDYFKSQGKEVYLVGISFGSFIVQDLLARHGDIADKYAIVVGRLDMTEEVWRAFSLGNYVGFEDGVNVIPFNSSQAGMDGGGSVEDKNMAKIAAGLGYKRYTELLKDIDFSNLTYVYAKSDEQVGRLTEREINFLESKGAQVFSVDGGHDDAIDYFIKKGLHLLR